MEGMILEKLFYLLDTFSDEIVIILLALAAIVMAIFMWVFVYNRRRFQHLKHQIPAAVVKSYLDSIIQNSASLKSSLFRGGGMDIDPNGIPSVMPVGDLGGGSNVAVGGSSAEEVNALNAEIARLRTQLDEKKFQISDLESKNTDLTGDNKTKQARIEELEAMLANAGGEGGADPAALAAITKERDELKEKLQEYSVIEDDLANLKRLQQENEQLKKALEAAGGAAPAAEAPEPAPAPAPEPTPEPEPAPAPEPEPEPAAEEPVAAAEAEPAPEPAAPADDKSPEDLLSEFEKMLG
jgi:regulator of replication initiation timing